MRIRVRSARRLSALAALAAAVVAVPLIADDQAGAAPAAVALPPAHAGFDYQIGGAYTPCGRCAGGQP